MPTCHCLRDRYLYEGTSVSLPDMNIFWCSVSRRNSPNLWNRLQILCVMVLRRIVMYSCGVCWRGDLHSDGYVSSSTAAAHWVWLAHSRLTLSHRPGPSGTLRPTALELLLFYLFLSLFHTLRRKVGQGRCRDPRPNSVIRSQFLIRVVRFTFLLVSTFWIMFGYIRIWLCIISCFPVHILATINFKVQFSLLTNHSLLPLSQ